MTKFNHKAAVALLLAGVLLLAGCAGTGGYGKAGKTAQKPWESFEYEPLGEINLPDYQRVELDNGMILYLAEDHELPMIQLSATIQAGAIYEPGDKTGLASITGEVLRSGGTSNHSGDEIDEIIEAMGARVETWVGASSGGAYMSALTEDADRALDILADILMHPQFDPDKIDLSKNQHKATISRRNDEPMSIAFREFTKMIFGPEHPFGRNEEYDTIGSITRDDLVDFHADYFHPDRMWLVVIGDFDAEAMAGKIDAAFKGWEKASKPLPPDPEIPALPRTVNIAAKSDLTQSTVLVGHKGIRNDHEHYAGIQVANTILGGGFSSRLFNEVRSKRGLAYSTGSSGGTGWRFPGTFAAFAGTKSESTEEAITVILDEITRMTTEPVTEKELRVAVDGILNSDVFNYDTKREILDRLVLFEMNGYPPDFLSGYREAVQSMTAEKVLEAAKAVWKPGDLSILAVGNPEDFDGDLSTFGPVNMIDITIPEPRLTLDIPAATPASLEAGQGLIKAAAKAMGGKKLTALKGYGQTLDLALEIQGMALNFGIESTIVYPDRMKMVQKTPFGNMVQCLDGESGWADTPGGVQEITGDDLDAMREQIKGDLISILRDPSALSCQALDQAEYEGVLCDRVHVTGFGEDYKLVYLDAATHLPAMVQGKGNDPVSGSPVVSKTVYSDYTDFGGYKLAGKITILHDDAHFADGTVTAFTANPNVAADFFKNKK